MAFPFMELLAQALLVLLALQTHVLCSVLQTAVERHIWWQPQQNPSVASWLCHMPTAKLLLELWGPGACSTRCEDLSAGRYLPFEDSSQHRGGKTGRNEAGG